MPIDTFIRVCKLKWMIPTMLFQTVVYSLHEYHFCKNFPQLRKLGNYMNPLIRIPPLAVCFKLIPVLDFNITSDTFFVCDSFHS